MTDECRDGRLEVYLPSRSVDYPFMSACGHNATALKDLPLLTSKDVEEAAVGSSSAVSSSPSAGGDSQRSHPHRRRRRFVHVRFVGTAYPHKAQFKIAWSELNHLPKNSDGTLRTARRTADADECAFSCPGDERLCLPDRLVCNGVVNCPGSANGLLNLLNDESPTTCDLWSQRSAASASASATGDDFRPSAVSLFVAVTAAIVVFGVALFATNAYCHHHRRRPTVTNGCRATFGNSTRSSDRIYSTVILCIL